MKESDGYDPAFLDNIAVPLPELIGGLQDHAEPLFERFRKPGRPEYELTYTHFSIVMHRDRRIAMLSAVNIDGGKLYGLNRKTGEKYLYEDNRAALRARMAEADESSSWFFDDRIERSVQTGPNFYGKSDNNILVSPKNKGFAETLNFSRGHIVRRLDPVWGDTKSVGLAADADSHAWTNVAPQTPTFNANNRDAKDINPGEEKRLWAAAENAILRNAFDDKKRLTVFSGPVFGENDPVYAGLPDNEYKRGVPLAFWKVICWNASEGLRSLALLIEQKATMMKANGAEAMDDPAELLALRDYLTTVPKLEEKISMRFGENVRKADVWRRHADRAVADLDRDEFLDLINA